MDVLEIADAFEQARVFRRLLIPRLLALALAALVVGSVVPGFSNAARIGSVLLFLLPAAIAAAIEWRWRILLGRRFAGPGPRKP